MAWIIEFVIGSVAQLFGQAVGHNQPWWVEVVATIVAFVALLIALAIPIFLFSVFLG